MAAIKQGGKTSSLPQKPKIETLRFYSESPMSIYLMINDDSLSYLTVEEAVAIRDEINKAIKKAVNL